MNPKDNKNKEYSHLKEFAAYILLSVFCFMLIANVADDLFFGNKIQGIDPLLYGLVGTLLTLIFVGKLNS